MKRDDKKEQEVQSGVCGSALLAWGYRPMPSAKPIGF